MKVILLKEVRGLGHIGDIKEVKSGYGNNFLIAQGFASLATKHSIDMLKSQKNKIAKLKFKIEKDKSKLANILDNKVFNIKAKADEKGNLYAKLSKNSILKELTKEGNNINNEEIILKEAIKKIGKYNIKLKLANREIKIKLVINNL